MKVIFAVNHPSQYHIFKHLAHKIIEQNGEVIFFIQSREIIEDLVTADGFEFKYSVSPKIRNIFKGRLGIIIRGVLTIAIQEYKLFSYVLRHKVDFLMGSDVAIAHVGFLFRKKVFVFADDDYSFIKQYSRLAYPFCTHIIASEVVDVHKWDYKRIAYYGTQKSAYLHPKYFVPNLNVLSKYNLKGKRFFIIRLVNFAALHDSIHGAYTGLSGLFIEKLLNYLEPIGTVIINVENGLNSKYVNYSPKIDPEDMHSLMYYSDLLIGDSQSMVIEASLLGTPAIRSNKWVLSDAKVNVIEYLEKQYSLFYSVAPNDDDEIMRLTRNLTQPDIKKKWAEKRKKFFSENTDLTEFLFWLMKDYHSNLLEYNINRDKVLSNFCHVNDNLEKENH